MNARVPHRQLTTNTRPAMPNTHDHTYEPKSPDPDPSRPENCPSAASFGNRKLLERSARCGCFTCYRVYAPYLIVGYSLEHDGRQTAWCPYCGIDTVLAEASGFTLTPESLKRLGGQ